jgi:hypothetical protein
MVLKIFVIWMALGVLAVLFVYCCSRVSNGRERELTDDEYEFDPEAVDAMTSNEARLRDGYEPYPMLAGSRESNVRCHSSAES